MQKQDEQLEILRALDKKSNMTQRDLSNTLGFSLGKINYCLNALKDKGFIKIENFSKSNNKIKYAYVLTPKGIAEKTKLTYNFLKRKMKEYEELQKELKELKK
jgi:EPS-associated MarR family transcriptional regulator